MSVDLGVVQLQSLVACCDTMRAHHEEVALGFDFSLFVNRLGRGGRGQGRGLRVEGLFLAESLVFALGVV